MSDSDDVPASKPLAVDEDCSAGWLPGVDTGPFQGRLVPLEPQSQVLVANVVLNARRLPGALLHSILEITGHAGQARGSLAMQCASAFLRVAQTTVRKCMDGLRQNGWKPTKPAQPQRPFMAALQDDGAAHSLVASPRLQSDGLETLVRVALANAVEGGSLQRFERDVARYKLSGVFLGNKSHSRHFAREVECIASIVLSQLDSIDWGTPLCGIGIVSDFGVMMDPVSIGPDKFPRHDTTLMMCLSMASCHTHKLYTPMVGGKTMDLHGHSGDALAKLSLQSLWSHPAGFGMVSLRARLAVIGGDGQIVLGGPEHRHNSSQAAEKMWQLLHPGEVAMTCWDPFHRADTACMRAIRRNALAHEVYDMAKQMDTLFGLGEGKILLRGLAEALETRASKLRAPGGTRKVARLTSANECRRGAARQRGGA